MKKIIALAGEIACGKGTVVSYLTDKYGANSVRFSDCLRDIASRLYLERSRENYQKVSLMIRQTFGEDIMSKVIAEDAKNLEGNLILLDGARREMDLKYLKELEGFNLVYIDVDQNIRYERIIKRGENTDEIGKTFEQFQKDSEAEAEVQIRGLKSIANFVLDNSGDIDNLKKQIDNMMKKIK